MKILKIELENVKSYQNEVIQFHDGINVIAGRNGAGKSTLIESIGLALFGYMNKDYKYQDFLSHGSKNGKIAIDFEVDNCQYKIERSFTSSGTKGWVIFDYQTDETIETHTIEDVNYTLGQILRIGEDITLAELFERIIGVNQGCFTEPFLRSTSGRKEYFEKIFMLDSYKTAYQKSGDTASLLRKQVDEVERMLIQLRTRVENYQQIRDEYKEAEGKVKEQKKVLKENQKEFAITREQVQELKQIQERIQKLEREALQFTEQEKQLGKRLEQLKVEIETSSKAQELVERYQETRVTYVRIKGEIGQLDEKLELQQKLEQEKQELEKIVAVGVEKLKGKAENIQGMREALLKEYDERGDEIEEYSMPLEGIERELKLVTDELSKVERVSEELTVITRGYQLCENLCHKLEDRLHEKKGQMTDLANLEKRLAELPQLKEEVEELFTLEKALEEVNHAISVLETRILSDQENMERVGDGLCPILHTECKTLQGQNLREYFLGKVEELTLEKQERLREKESLTEKIQKLRVKQQELLTLQAMEEQSQRLKKRLVEIEEAGYQLVQQISTNLGEIYQQLNQVKKVGFLVGAGELTFKEILPLELAREYSWIGTELDIVTNHLTEAEKAVQTQEKRLVEKKDEVSQRKVELLAKISQLKDRQKEINHKLAELTEDEKALTKEQEDLQIDQEKIKVLEEELQNFGDLKGQMKSKKEELADLEEGNSIYLQNQQKAAELISLREMEEKLDGDLTVTKGKLADVELGRKAEQERFDPECLQELEGRVEELNGLKSRAETLISEGERQVEKLAGQLVEMKEIKVQIKEKEAEESRLKKGLNLMNFIRNVYNTSAEEIANVFLQFISHDATNIYRQLSGENVQLIWEKDYQVKLKDKYRTRLFRQLSGGEQMSAAFAIRLALLRKFSSVRIGFFDEPTTHLDEQRRMNIAQAIAQIREKDDNYFEQIFVISHDDTFTTLTENMIRLDKDDSRGSYLVKE